MVFSFTSHRRISSLNTRVILEYDAGIKAEPVNPGRYTMPAQDESCAIVKNDAIEEWGEKEEMNY